MWKIDLFRPAERRHIMSLTHNRRAMTQFIARTNVHLKAVLSVAFSYEQTCYATNICACFCNDNLEMFNLMIKCGHYMLFFVRCMQLPQWQLLLWTKHKTACWEKKMLSPFYVRYRHEGAGLRFSLNNQQTARKPQKLKNKTWKSHRKKWKPQNGTVVGLFPLVRVCPPNSSE